MIHKIIPVLWIAAVVSFFFQSVDAQGQAQIITRIDSLMRSHYTPDKPGCALIVYQENRLLMSSGYGLANLETSEVISPQTTFRIGSMTKQFTAIAILMLVEEGLLALDDPIYSFFPELFTESEAITIRHLLTHTAGIKDLSRIPAVRPLIFEDTPAYRVMELISQEPFGFTPGERYAYSNSGYVILGNVIEKLSDITYWDFLKKHIFDPLDMDDTYAHLPQDIENVAAGYFTRPDSYAPAPVIHSSLLFAAGGLWSTVGDMAKWNLALDDDRLVGRQLIESAFSPYQLNNGTDTDYGFGFRACQVNDVPSIEHGGGVFGYSSYGIRIEQPGVYVLILSNFERSNPYDELAARIAALVAGRPYEDRSLYPDHHTTDLQQIAGHYVTSAGDTLQIQWSEDVLSVFDNDGHPVPLLPIDKYVFVKKNTLDNRITFIPERKGLFIKPRSSPGITARRID